VYTLYDGVFVCVCIIQNTSVDSAGSLSMSLYVSFYVSHRTLCLPMYVEHYHIVCVCVCVCVKI
jgi:hypothetical protein